MTTKRERKATEVITAKTESTEIQRDALGRIVKGSGAINAGGLTPEARMVRDGMLAWIGSPEMQAAFKSSYKGLLEEQNPIITKDCAERLMGKVKDIVEHQGDAPMRLTMLTREEILAIAKGEEVK